jgi:hypothetical protein
MSEVASLTEWQTLLKKRLGSDYAGSGSGYAQPHFSDWIPKATGASRRQSTGRRRSEEQPSARPHMGA